MIYVRNDGQITDSGWIGRAVEEFFSFFQRYISGRDISKPLPSWLILLSQYSVLHGHEVSLMESCEVFGTQSSAKVGDPIR